MRVVGRHEKILSRKWPREIGALEESPAVWVMDGAVGCARNRTERFKRPARGNKSRDGCPGTGPGGAVRPLSVVGATLSVDEATREGRGVGHCVFGKREHRSREFVLPVRTQNIGDFDGDGREI